MTGYFSNFIEHSGQFSALVSVLTLWLGLTALGAFVSGPKRLTEAAPLYGWAVLSIVFMLGGIFTRISFSAMSVGLAAAAIPAGIIAYRRGGALLPHGFHRTLILLLPLLILVSAMVGSQWDEFSHWLITPRLLLEMDILPTNAEASRGSSLLAYPYGWTFINYAASRLAGRLLENAGALSNVLLLITFAMLVVRLIGEGIGLEREKNIPSWTLCAIGGLLAIPFNPTFAQKVALTAYADTPTAVALAFAAFLGWKMLDALSRQETKEAVRISLSMGLVLLVLVNMKQATFVLFVLVVCSVLLVGLRDSKINFRDLLRTLPGMILPPLIIFFLWRYYVSQELTGKEFIIRPFSGWFIDDLPQILGRMLIVLSKKGLYLALLLVVSGFAVRGLIRMKTPLDRLAVITGGVMLGYNAFLLFSYVAAFGKYEALHAASMWRYNMHLGLSGVAFAAYGGSLLWKSAGENHWTRRIPAVLPIILIVAAPFIFANKLRFDKVLPVPHYRQVSRDLTEILNPGDRLLNMDLEGSGESGIIARFELGGDIYLGTTSAYHAQEVADLLKTFNNIKFTHLLLHSITPALLKALGMDLPEDGSYLLKKDGNGSWIILKHWPYPEGFPIH